MNGKIISYLGFCIRSGKICYGVDDIEQYRKRVYLLIMDEGLGESSKKSVLKSRERFGCPLLIAEAGALGEMLHKPAVKAVAIKDNHLASAILSAADGETKLKIYGGNEETYGKERL